MSLSVHVMDKLCPGLHHCVTLTTDATGTPKASIRLAGAALPSTVERLDTKLYKVRFHLPKTAKGELEMEFQAGPDRALEKKVI